MHNIKKDSLFYVTIPQVWFNPKNRNLTPAEIGYLPFIMMTVWSDKGRTLSSEVRPLIGEDEFDLLVKKGHISVDNNGFVEVKMLQHSIDFMQRKEQENRLNGLKGGLISKHKTLMNKMVSGEISPEQAVKELAKKNKYVALEDICAAFGLSISSTPVNPPLSTSTQEVSGNKPQENFNPSTIPYNTILDDSRVYNSIKENIIYATIVADSNKGIANNCMIVSLDKITQSSEIHEIEKLENVNMKIYQSYESQRKKMRDSIRNLEIGKKESECLEKLVNEYYEPIKQKIKLLIQKRLN